jgi:hypothetical protein
LQVVEDFTVPVYRAALQPQLLDVTKQALVFFRSQAFWIASPKRRSRWGRFSAPCTGAKPKTSLDADE